MPKAFGGLVPYYEEFVPEHFPLPDGTPRGRRSAEKIAKRYNLPLIHVHKITFIDPVMAAERLREFATPKREQPPRKPRGRPRKYNDMAEVRAAGAEKRRLAKIAQSAEGSPPP
jgi:hypothetical protein